MHVFLVYNYCFTGKRIPFIYLTVLYLRERLYRSEHEHRLYLPVLR